MAEDETIVWEFKPIEWYHFSPVLEDKGLCIFCNKPATHMRRQSQHVTSHWQALCEDHKNSTELK